MNQMKDTINTILDIAPPPAPPDDNTLFLSVMALFTTAIIVILVLWRKKYAGRQRSRRQIRRLYKSIEHKTINIQSCAYELSATLRNALGLSKLTTSTALPIKLAAYQDRWLDFTKSLDQARYSAEPCTVVDIKKLLKEAEFWIKRWPIT